MSDLNLVGGAGVDVLDGGAGNDTLDGGGGADTLRGAAGNDAYHVDSILDQVIENADEGTDTVIASISYLLSANVEHLTLTGSAVFALGNNLDNHLTGNALDNTLLGNDGADRLDGGVGADLLIGGSGNDTYVVDNAGDVLVEASGIDTVESSISYVLASDLENLTLTGSAVISGEGNGGGNVITGNSGNNLLIGRGGADTLDGGAGIDTAQVAGSATFTNNGSAWTVVSSDGSDTLTNVEIVMHGGGRTLLVGATGYATIQAAVDAAASGDTILIAAGTYREQVLVSGKDLTIRAFDGAVLEMPDRANIVSSGGYNSALTVVGADVDVINLDIDGRGQGGPFVSQTFAGAAFINADGSSFSDGHVTGFHAPPAQAGNQHGYGILVRGTDGGSHHVEIAGNTIDNFQKNGIDVRETGSSTTLTVSIHDNEITGWGATGLIAQNGVVIGFGATGAVSDNVVSDIGYTGSNATAAGILVYQGNGVDVTGNDVTMAGTATSSAAISLFSAEPGTITGNTVGEAGIGVEQTGSFTAPAIVGGNTFGDLGTHFSFDPADGAATAYDADGTGGEDVLDGAAGNDVLDGGAGDDAIVGGAGTDTTHVTGAASFAAGGSNWTIASDDGVDTVTGVEIVVHGGGRTLLVGSTGFASIQAAVNAAEDGDTILIADGLYAESVTLSKAVTLQALNPGAVTIDPLSGNGITISGDIDDGGAATVAIDGINVNGANAGIQVSSSTVLATLSVTNGSFTGNSLYAIGTGNGVPGLGNVVITDSTFIDNGVGPASPNGSGAIVLFGYTGDATLESLVITTTSTASTPQGARADNAIQIHGGDPATYDVTSPAGTIVFDNVDITGFYHKAALMIQGYTDLSGISFADSSVSTGSNWGYPVFVDPVVTTGTGAPGVPGMPGHFAGGADESVLDLSGLAVTNLSTSPFDVSVRGTDADDTQIGTNAADWLNQPSEGAIDRGGDDTLEGRGGDDLLFGGAGDDDLDGGADHDTAAFGGARAGYGLAVTYGLDGRVNGFTGVEDTDAGNGDEGEDTLAAIEMLSFADVTLDVTDLVQLFSGGVLTGTFDSLAGAVAAAADGDTIRIGAGTLVGDAVISKAVTILGAGAGSSAIGRDPSDGSAASNIVGHIKVTAVGDVTIDGVRFVNTAATTGGGPSNPALQLSTGGGANGHLVTNSVFWSEVAGGVTPAPDDRAIATTVIGGGNIAITNNVISGASEGQFGTASWGRGIWFDGGGVHLVVTGNLIEWTRSALNLDMSGSSTATVVVNRFHGVGTSVSVGVDTDGVALFNNHYEQVDTDFNFRNLTGGVTFDADPAMATLTPFDAGNDAIKILGGAGGDDLTGTEDSDILDGNGLSAVATDADELHGEGGEDLLLGKGGDDTLDGGAGDDTLDGGAGIDTATVTGPFTYQANPGNWQIASAGGLDTLVNVEVVQSGGSRTLLVGSTGFATLQAAIDAANPGDTILIAPGTYAGDVTIDVDVTILGNNPSANGDVPRGPESILAGTITIAAAGVTIDGVQFSGESTPAGPPWPVGVYVTDAGDNLIITHSVFETDYTPPPSGDIVGLVTGTVQGLQVHANTFHGYTVGVYVSGPSTGSIHSNVFQGDWSAGDPDNFFGMGNGVNSESSSVTVYGNTFDSLYSGAVNVLAFGPAAIDIEGFVHDNSFVDGRADRPIQIYPNGDVTSVTGSEENEAFVGDGVAPGRAFTFFGEGGHDRLYGGEEGDTLAGGAGDDGLFGNGGNDSLDGGEGADALDGGAGTDTASFTGTLTAADFSYSGGSWHVGGDTLAGVEVVTDGSGNVFRLVGADGTDGYATIQAAVNDADAGDVLLVAAGTYDPFTVDVDVTITGVGSVTIEGTFRGINSVPDGVSVGEWLQTATAYNGAGGIGAMIAADGVTLENLSFTGLYAGVSIGNSDNLTLTDVSVSDSVHGVAKTGNTVASGFTMTGGSLTDSYIGFIVESNGHPDASFDTVLLDGVTFENLTEKGFYADNLSNAQLLDLVMTNVGEFGRGPAFGAAGAGEFGAGIDINLKYGDYSNIEIGGFTFTDVGSSSTPDSVPLDFGAAIAIKARDDAPSYSSNPATLTGVDIHDGTINGTATGVRIGEPGKGNAGPTNVSVENVTISGADFASFDNPSLATLTVIGTSGADSYTTGSTTVGPVDFSGGGDNDNLTGGGANDSLDGGDGDDTLNGGDGNDILRSGGGADVLNGGSGFDTAYLSPSTSLFSMPLGWISSSPDGNDVLNGVELAILGSQRQLLVGATAFASVGAATGSSLVQNGDSILLAAGTHSGSFAFNHTGLTVLGQAATLNATFSSASNFGITILGGSSADVITTGGGNDVIDGKGGADTMSGLGGDDWYFVDNAADVVNESAGAGTGDRIFAGVSYALGAGVHVEWLTTTDNLATTAINLTGNELANIVHGNAGANVLEGLGGADTLQGNGGNDTYYVDDIGDNVVEGAAGEGTNDQVFASVSYGLGGRHIELLTLTGTGNINGTGNGLSQTIVGNSGSNLLSGLEGADVLQGMDGDDTLDGGAGTDTMTGGTGNDTYYVEDAGDNVIESAAGDGANDRVFSSVSYGLGGRYIELLTLTGVGNINGTGNNLAQTIIGNAGDNILDGLGGADTLNGGNGNDIYFVDDVGDNVQETSATGGTADRIIASVSYSLGGRYVETLTLAGTGNIDGTGNSLAQTIVGNSGNNVLTGLQGDDVLNGGTGADTMVGGADNDTYYVDDIGDNVVEGAAGEGTNDQVFSSISYSLGGRYIEVLQLTGTGNINGTGNSFGQTIIGNSGNNVLDGLGGADVLQGMAGNDTYFVDDVGDNVVESAAGDGTNDQVYSSVSYSLGGRFIEVMTLTGTGNINGTGNSLAQTIVGNSGNNVLDGLGGADILQGFGGDDTLNGGAGADTMTGNGGNDIYYVDDIGDNVIEPGAGDGTNDQVFSSVSYSLGGRFIEVMTLIGGGNIDGTGNSLGQTIIGNSGNNVLDGLGGDDVLAGGAGSDTFRFTASPGAGNVDTITDYSVVNDTIQIENAVFTGLAAGALAAGAFNTGAAATQADDRIIYDSATGVLLFDVDGVGGAAAVQFATLSPGLAMAASEFFVI